MNLQFHNRFSDTLFSIDSFDPNPTVRKTSPGTMNVLVRELQNVG
jgi:hypothetical protein